MFKINNDHSLAALARDAENRKRSQDEIRKDFDNQLKYSPMGQSTETDIKVLGIYMLLCGVGCSAIHAYWVGNYYSSVERFSKRHPQIKYPGDATIEKLGLGMGVLLKVIPTVWGIVNCYSKKTKLSTDEPPAVTRERFIREIKIMSLVYTILGLGPIGVGAYLLKKNYSQLKQNPKEFFKRSNDMRGAKFLMALGAIIEVVPVVLGALTRYEKSKRCWLCCINNLEGQGVQDFLPQRAQRRLRDRKKITFTLPCQRKIEMLPNSPK